MVFIEFMCQLLHDPSLESENLATGRNDVWYFCISGLAQLLTREWKEIISNDYNDFKTSNHKTGKNHLGKCTVSIRVASEFLSILFLRIKCKLSLVTSQRVFHLHEILTLKNGGSYKDGGGA